MGIHFRSSGYLRRVFFSGRTIKDGEAAAIWNSRGVHKQVIGPRRIWLFNSTLDFLDRFRAEPHQYLRVAYRDGRIEHIQGPMILYKNPMYHDKISVHDGIMLKSNSECIVVYNTNQTTMSETDIISGIDNATMKSKSKPIKDELVVALPAHGLIHDGNRKIVFGPTIFFPQPHEMVHDFAWSTLSEQKAPKFQIINTRKQIDSIEVCINTSDRFSFQAELILDYHINSMDKVIASHDPISKIHHGIMADSQTLGLSISSDMLRDGKQEEVINLLKNIDSYSQLKCVSEDSGITIDNVRVTKISLGEKLSQKIDSERREVEQRQNEINQKLQLRKINELEMEDRRKAIKEEADLRQSVIDINHDLDQLALERKLILERKEAEAKQHLMKINSDGVLHFLKELKNLGVDMTEFMVTYASSGGGMDLAAPMMKGSGSLNDKVQTNKSNVITTTIPKSS